MKDLTAPFWIKVKGGLFLLLGCAAGALLVAEQPSWKVAALLVLAVWSFCRAYYFAFYVIERYVDSSYKFSGLGSFLRYCWSRKRGRGGGG